MPSSGHLLGGKSPQMVGRGWHSICGRPVARHMYCRIAHVSPSGASEAKICSNSLSSGKGLCQGLGFRGGLGHPAVRGSESAELMRFASQALHHRDGRRSFHVEASKGGRRSSTRVALEDVREEGNLAKDSQGGQQSCTADSEAAEAEEEQEGDVSLESEEEAAEFFDEGDLLEEEELEEGLEGEEEEEEEDFWGDLEEEAEAQEGDGGQGGGVVLGGAPWGQLALEKAQLVLARPQFGADMALFAFRVLPTQGVLRVRLDKLSNEYGSPSLEEIEAFSRGYQRELEGAGAAGLLPPDLALEVSSPGAERVVKVPSELTRFKDLPMFVRYAETDKAAGQPASEREEILSLVEVDEGLQTATWKVANVKKNRDAAGKGRTLTKKQRDRRVVLSFSDMKLVHVYLDI